MAADEVLKIAIGIKIHEINFNLFFANSNDPIVSMTKNGATKKGRN